MKIGDKDLREQISDDNIHLHLVQKLYLFLRICFFFDKLKVCIVIVCIILENVCLIIIYLIV